ncbi:MAG TPA: hypothetical protein VMX94_02590 [Armatimonadota bacterium]|nr:hypothetical protein [Armatimonadota bacterium]
MKRHLVLGMICSLLALAILPACAQGQSLDARPPSGFQAGDLTYTPQEIRSTAAEVFLERMEHPKSGYQWFVDMKALIQKAKESGPAARTRIMSPVIRTMHDKSHSVYQRYQCCYVISGSEYEPGIRDLIRVLHHDESDTMRSVAAEALVKFPKSAAAHDALLQAARQETSQRVRDVLIRRKVIPAPPRTEETKPPGGSPTGDLLYTPDQIRSTSAETFLERMLHAESGYHPFAALRALIQKAKESGPAARTRIMSLVIKTMHDKSHSVYQRWQCCYVISGSEYEPGIPDLIQVLHHDESEIMRSVAAEALADFPKSAAAHGALLQAARQETSQRVREVFIRRKVIPAPPPSPAPVPARRGHRPLVVVDGAEGKEYDGTSIPIFSPDSNHIAYEARRGHKWLVVVDRAEGKEYDHVESPVFSSDSKRIAYRAKRGDKWLVVVDGA